MATYEANQLYRLPLTALQPDPVQPRKYMDPDALEELTASVSRMGIIQPVVCRQDRATGQVYVVAGERRCTAARKAGLATVPAVFVDGADCAAVALVENLLREDLNPVEEAEALKRLMDEHAYQQAQLAALIGKSQPTISESLSLNKLPQEIRDECRQDPNIPKRTLVEIARKKQKRSMLTHFRKYRALQARDAVRDRAGAPGPGPRKRTRAEALVNSIAMIAFKIGSLEFPEFSDEDRNVLIVTMASLKETLDNAITRAMKNKNRQN